MAAIYWAQALVPLALVVWLAVAPPRSKIGFAIQVVATAAALLVLARIGIWIFPPWWTPHAAAVLLLLAALWRWHRRTPRSWWPSGVWGWSGALLFTVLGAVSAGYGARAFAGSRPPDQPAVALAWPLRGATFLVVNGGNDLLINAHLESMVSPHPRLRPWRGNGWALDFVAIDAFGLRALGFMPADPARYRIFGMPVLAPCSGTVVQAVDGLPDMPVPEYDRQHMAGNHVILACGDVHIAMGHLERGSVRVKVGDSVAVSQPLGNVGNSGGTDEPHLHIHAQRPGPPGAPMGGDPLPARFDGRFLVRGDRVAVPQRKPAAPGETAAAR